MQCVIQHTARLLPFMLTLKGFSTALGQPWPLTPSLTHLKGLVNGSRAFAIWWYLTPQGSHRSSFGCCLSFHRKVSLSGWLLQIMSLTDYKTNVCSHSSHNKCTPHLAGALGLQDGLPNHTLRSESYSGLNTCELCICITFGQHSFSKHHCSTIFLLNKQAISVFAVMLTRLIASEYQLKVYIHIRSIFYCNNSFIEIPYTFCDFSLAFDTLQSSTNRYFLL